jgi:hypothetical protein
MTQLTSNTTAFIEAQQYSQFIIDNLEPFLLPEIFWRDVSDFGHGTTLNIKTVGDVVLQEAAEDTVLNTLMGMRALASTRAFAEHHETRFLTVASTIQTDADVNLVNGLPHRWVAGGAAATNRVMTLEDFAVMGLAFDEADVPAEGRVAIVPPVVATTIELLTNLVNVSNNPMFKGIVETGFARNHKFVANVYGWDVWTSARMPAKTATEALDASTYGLANDTAEVGDKPCIFMNIADDNTKPIMHAWRNRPGVEGWRDHEERKDKFQAVSKFGLAGQRADTIGVVWVHPTSRS